ncbi:early endosome antigen 1 [Balamuthia mandrillaris]
MDGEGAVTYGTTTGSSLGGSGGGGGGSLYSFLPSGWEAGKPVVAQGPTTAPPAFTPMPSQTSAFYGGPTFPTTAMPMSQHLANAVDEEDEEDDDYEQQQQQWGWQQEQFRRMEAEALLRRKEIEGQLAKLNAEKVDAENSGGATTNQEEEEEEEEEEGTARRLLEKEKEIENLRKELEEKNELVRQLASAKSKERSTRDTYASTKTTDRKQKRVSNGEVSLGDAESLLDTMQLERPKWVEDKYAASCQRCTIPFSTFKRRHHCRGCGKVFCHECSNTWLLLPKALGYPTPQRTCEACYRSLSTLDYSTFHDIYGPEDAPVLVLLHAAFATRKSFGRQIEALQSRYKLLIPDLPGHAIRVIEDILAKYASHSKSITLVGFSLGGYVAMAFAATHPSLVTAIIVAGAEVGMPGGAVLAFSET